MRICDSLYEPPELLGSASGMSEKTCVARARGEWPGRVAFVIRGSVFVQVSCETALYPLQCCETDESE